MSSAATSPAQASTAPASTPAWSEAGPGGRSRRRWRAPALWALVAALVVLAVSLLTGGHAPGQGSLDPDSALGDGSLAVRSVLADHGVQVVVVRSQAQLLRASVASDTTVVVTDTDRLSDSTGRAALRHVAGAARLVLMSPGPRVLTGLAIPVEPAYDARYAAVRAACQDPDAARAGEISGGEIGYTAEASADGAVGCFAGLHGSYQVTLPRSADRPAVTVLGCPDVLRNRHVTESGNAALALGILGDTPRLVWYVPDVDDTPVGDASTVASALPPWLSPALLLGWSALLALLLWRGRRLGRLVTEPLPVVVRAVETTQSRGRMYRKAGDRARALAVLQAGTRSRLARYLGLPVTAAPAAVVTAVSAATGRPALEVASLLVSATAPDDPSLLAIAGDLATLEKEVRRR